ncbi:hypothetical protein KIK06_17925 [Nocardiopsis sp. EMB25]|uniref:hypothetical protein n=1 Tax=Nocardiopsis sp. EMB25 TaxID=2835867 RepID=UPI0022846AE5|nr:hypothetical protein [Nocardiopsis sp. EMB25]MCY9785769.1 hypothetical protein [Nocardiopsis sp. EMB25]
MSARADLARLRAEYGDRYWIRCTEHTWIATDRAPHTTTEPTLMADTPGQLAKKLASPGPCVGMPFPTGVYGADPQAAPIAPAPRTPDSRPGKAPRR